jgi:hypothetical protein
MKYIIQSIILRKDKFTQREAEQWIREHGYKLTKPDVTRHFYRFRQHEPLPNVHYRTVELGTDGEMIIGYPNKR